MNNYLFAYIILYNRFEHFQSNNAQLSLYKSKEYMVSSNINSTQKRQGSIWQGISTVNSSNEIGSWVNNLWAKLKVQLF